MVTITDIQQFLEPKKMAVAGASRNPKKFGGMVFRELLKKGYDVYPINPETREIEGVKCYASVHDLPEEVKHLLIVTPPKNTDEILRSAIDHGLTQIWVQQRSDTPETIRIAGEHPVKLITGKCIFMFAQPVTGFHKFHRFVRGFFGRLPG
jgi:predicted CoA-binding protein